MAGALAFDKFTDGGQLASGTALTPFNHVNKGNTVLVGTEGDTVSDLINVVTATIGGTAYPLTKLPPIQIPVDRWISLWYWQNALQGTLSIAVSASGTTFIQAGAVSYLASFNVDDVSTNTAASPATSITGTVGTKADNSWVVGLMVNDAGSPAAGTGTTRRGLVGALNMGFFDSNGGLSPGFNSIQATLAGGENWASIVVALAPQLTSAQYARNQEKMRPRPFGPASRR